MREVSLIGFVSPRRYQFMILFAATIFSFSPTLLSVDLLDVGLVKGDQTGMNPEGDRSQMEVVEEDRQVIV